MKAFRWLFYAFMRILITPYFFLTGYRYKRYLPKSRTFLVLGNHNTDWDFFLYGLPIKRRQVTFVSSEHVLRAPVTGPIIKFLANPIPRRKGASGDEAARLILERLKAGGNVCMMAEGNRSFSGETGFISPRTAKLVKESGAGLITMALHGGYFINPRWGSKKRKGRYYGEVVREYTAEELSRMSVEEIYGHICSDLYVNAYTDQERSMERYTCKAPAENLETALFACDSCGSLSSMQSEGDLFRCTCCGSTVRFNASGYFEGVDGTPPAHRTVLDRFNWQKGFFKDYITRQGSEPGRQLLRDGGVLLSAARQGTGAGETVLQEGEMALYPDRLEFSGSSGSATSIRIDSISKISLVRANKMLFTAEDGYYQVTGPARLCTLKYLMAVRFLQGKEYI